MDDSMRESFFLENLGWMIGDSSFCSFILSKCLLSLSTDVTTGLYLSTRREDFFRWILGGDLA
jgi:hypothetical protein